MAQTPTYGARGKMRIREYPEAASQTFVKGDLLILDSNGRVQQAVAAGSRVGATSGAITNRIIGRAESNASGTTGKYVPVLVAEPGTEFLMRVHHATPASAVPNTNQLGKQYEVIHVDDTIDWYGVSLDNTTNVKLKISDMVPGAEGHDGFDTTGIPTAASTIQYGKVWVEFMSAHTILGGVA